MPDARRPRPDQSFPRGAGIVLVAGAGLTAAAAFLGFQTAGRWLGVAGIFIFLGGFYGCLVWWGAWSALRNQARRAASFRPAPPMSPPPGPAAQAAGTREWLRMVRRARLIRVIVWLLVFGVSTGGLWEVFAWSFRPSSPAAAPGNGPAGLLGALALLLFATALLGLVFAILLMLASAPRARRLLARSAWQEAKACGSTVVEHRSSADAGPGTWQTVTRVAIELDGQVSYATLRPLRSGVRPWNYRYTRLPVPPNDKPVPVWVSFDGAYGLIAAPGGSPVLRLVIRG